MTILLNKAHYPVEVLGPGRRVGIWVQGCTIRCFGCISRDTWPADAAMGIEVSAILDWMRDLPDEVDGVTISGGEPFDQPEALAELLDGIEAWRSTRRVVADVLCYSGRSLEELQSEFPELLGRLDAVVAEPYVHGAATDAPLVGSSNQRVVAMTPLGTERYTGEALAALGVQRGRLQVDVDRESIWFIGIPEQGAMTAMREEAAAAGVRIRRPSWLV